jgi:hypothetical protein
LLEEPDRNSLSSKHRILAIVSAFVGHSNLVTNLSGYNQADRVSGLDGGVKMDRASARHRAIEYLTTVVADCTDALGAADIWADYPPRDREKSLALFQEKRDVAGRLLANLKADEPIARADWKRVIPSDAGWTDVYKALFSHSPDQGNPS